MNERGHIKIVDFGFAKQLKKITDKTNTNCGTPSYIAPEILRGDFNHGFEVDIWSLGILMVELISGQTPFMSDSTQGVYENINKCLPQYNKFVTQPLREILAKIFVPDPELRISLEKLKEDTIFKVRKYFKKYNKFIKCQEFDFTVPIKDRFDNSLAPYIP